MQNDCDIKENRTMPYSVPEGYFEAMPDRILGRISERKKFRYTPYAAAVAAAAILTAVLFRPSDISEEVGYDSFAYAEIIPKTDPDAIWHDCSYDDVSSDEGLSSEDIVNYLLYTGVEVESLHIE